MTRFNGGCGFISSLSNLVTNSPFLMPNNFFYTSNLYRPMSSIHFLVPLFTLSLLCLLVLSFSLYRRQRRRKLRVQEEQNLDDPFVEKQSPTDTVGERDQSHENEPTHLTHSLLLEILPSDSQQWASLFAEKGGDDSVANGSSSEDVKGPVSERGGKKKKKRAKKKKANLQGEDGGSGVNKGNSESGSRVKEDLVCLYPFTSTGSATQRKIKQQYDQLMKCNEAKGLTLAQVGQFANCLIEARNELQHKSEAIQRKFTITKALLFKADRSSFDRLRQQIYKLELEQKRLEEDAFVYNWLQQQLKLSPAYKKMVEISENMELKAKSAELIEDRDTEIADISFEELLAQEKKDSFWMKNGKARQCSTR